MRSELLEAADRLWEATTTSVPCAPVRDVIDPGQTVDAYAVQQWNVQRWVNERGWRVVGHKIGLTSPAVQAQLGVDQPDFGALFAELGHLDGDVIPVGTLLQPKVEAEVALVLGDDLDGANPTAHDVRAATSYAVAALEVVDSRIADWDITFVDTVADNASSGRYVLSNREISLDSIDLATVNMTMSVNYQQVSTGNGAACLGNPLIAAAWLAGTMEQMGTPLRAGNLVLTGALGPMATVAAGDVASATIDGLGSVEIRFAGGES